jgi:hypothetical protein
MFGNWYFNRTGVQKFFDECGSSQTVSRVTSSLTDNCAAMRTCTPDGSSLPPPSQPPPAVAAPTVSAPSSSAPQNSGTQAPTRASPTSSSTPTFLVSAVYIIAALLTVMV